MCIIIPCTNALVYIDTYMYTQKYQYRRDGNCTESFVMEPKLHFILHAYRVTSLCDVMDRGSIL